MNYHHHNRYSSDGEGETREVLEWAQRLGVRHLCITNHVEVLQDPDRDHWTVDAGEVIVRLGALKQELDTLAPEFPEVEARFGAELEFRPEWRDELDRIVDGLPFDFLIGSVHVVDGRQVSGGPNVMDYFDGQEQQEAYTGYFRTVADMVEWGRFDVVGHMDLVKRFGAAVYGSYRVEPLRPVLEPLLDALVERGLGLDINTSGLYSSAGEIFPGPELLALAVERGVRRFTIGADSHRPKDLDRGLLRARKHLVAAGVSCVTLFRERVAESVNLEEAFS